MAINKIAAKGIDVLNLHRGIRSPLGSSAKSKYADLTVSKELGEGFTESEYDFLSDGSLNLPDGGTIEYQVLQMSNSDRKLIIATIPITAIHREDHNSRTVYSDEQLQALREDIEANGQEKPVEVNFQPGKGFVLLDGETRVRIAEMRGQTHVDALIVPKVKLNDWLDKLNYSFRQNDKRNKTCDYDVGRAFLRAIEKGFSREEVAEKLGISQKFVRDLVPVCAVPEKTEKALLKNGRLFSRHHLEHIKRLSTMSDAAAAEVVLDCARRHKEGDAISAALVGKLVTLKIDEINGVGGKSEHRDVDLFKPTVSEFRMPGKKKSFASVRVNKNPNGSQVLTIKSPDDPELTEKIMGLIEEELKKKGATRI